MNNLFDIDIFKLKIILLCFAPAAINIGIFLYVFFILSRNRTNIAFGIFVFVVALWQICGGFALASNTPQTAIYWFRISLTLLLYVVPLGLLFTFRFLRCSRKNINKIAAVVQFIPAILFSFIILTGKIKNEVIQSERWFWIDNPQPTLFSIIIYSWISLSSLLVLFILWFTYFKAAVNSIKKKQSFLLAIGFSIPIISGIITEILFPLLFGLDDIPVTTTIFTVFSLLSLFAIQKYRLLEFSPKHQWDQIIDTMNEGLLIVNNSDEIMFANKVFCEQMGYGFDEIKGKGASELFFIDELVKKETKTIIERRKNRISSQYEVKMKKKNGDVIWVLISGSPYLDRNKRVVGSIGIQTNITERKKAEEKIIKNSRLYSVLSYINQLIVHSDNESYLFKEACQIATTHGKFPFVFIATLNEEKKRISLIAESNALQEDLELFSDLSYDENGPTSYVIKTGTYLVINNFSNEPYEFKCKQFAHERGFASGIFLPIKKSGITIGTFNIFSSEADFFDKEEIDLLFEISGDISFALDVFEKEKQRKLAEEKLEHNKTRLKDAQAIAHVGSWELDFQTCIVTWSDEACRIYGLSTDANKQPYESWVKYVHPEDLDYVMKKIKETQASLNDSAFYHRIILKNGTIKHIYSKTQFDFDSAGNPTGIHGIVHDVTEQKKAENEILKLNEELEDKVMQRTIELAKANVLLEKEADMLQCASKIIEQKNKDVTDSLNYARIIQNATVNKKGILTKHFPHSFILNMPLHIVSGDFVRVDEKEENVLIALADCTGHGIPGALMSMIGYSYFNDVINYKHKITPSLVLRSLDSDFKHLTHESSEMNDGMDVGFCTINAAQMEINFAGAHRPLYIIRENTLIEIKGDNLSIGGQAFERKKFSNNFLKLQKDDAIYMFSDGYTDQFGGEKGRKYSTKRFKETLISIQHLTMKEQEEFLKSEINSWKGNLEQVDDICVLGIKI